MKTEMSQLEALKVGICLPEDEGRELAKAANVKILISRWVLTQKKVGLARCRLVVREFASGADSPFKSGIYAPTSSLDSLRAVLGIAHLRKLHLRTRPTCGAEGHLQAVESHEWAPKSSVALFQGAPPKSE